MRPGMLSSCGGFAAAVVTVCGSTTALAQAPRVIFSKAPLSDSSLVPGAKGANGQPAETRFRSIDRVTLSPGGLSWSVVAQTQQDPTLRSISILGGGLEGTAFAQQGQPVPMGGISETYDFLGGGRFNSQGLYAFTSTTLGGTGGPAVVALTTNGGTFDLRLRTGDLVTGLLDIDGEVSGDERIGDFMDAVHVLDDGRVGVHLESIINIDRDREQALIYDQTTFQQAVVSSIISRDGLGVEAWQRWDEEPFTTTPDGAHWFAHGRILADRDFDEVFAVDGRVVLQEAFPSPDGAVVIGGVLGFGTSGRGDWIAHGEQADVALPYACYNGQIVARTGTIIVNSTLSWAAPFFGAAANATGDWIVAGKSDAPASSDDVIVLAGVGIVLREGDPVDLNGDGLANDDAFVGRGDSALAAFAINQLSLSDERVMYAIVNLRNGAMQDLNSVPVFGEPSALLRVVLPPRSCQADFNYDGFVTGDDFDQFVAAFENGSSASDYDRDGFVTGTDFDLFAADFELGC